MQAIDAAMVAATTCLLSSAPSALAAPACAGGAPAPLPSPIVTAGSVTTRTGEDVRFQVEAGLLRVKGGGLALTKSVYTVPVEDRTAPAATATMSYYAYFAKAAGGNARPLIFVWDGGPGTSTRSMLLNSFGPVVSTLHDAPSAATSRNPVRPNPDSLLDVADLVFIDPPGTGFGRLEGCNAPRAFYGVDVDAAAFQRFIIQFVQAHHRESSPVVLMGESYGTMRAPVVAKRLEDAGVKVSAIVLISPMLSLDAWSDGSRANVGTNNAAYLTLPTYAATAWAHDKVPHNGRFEDWMREVERFSLDVYAPALLQGDGLAPEAKRKLADQLASYTGLSAQTWLDADFRIEGTRFRYLLEAADHKLVGREDTRVDGPAPKVRGTAVEDDPAINIAHPGRVSAFDTYVRGTLKLGAKPFVPYIDGPDTRWDVHHQTDPAAYPDTYVNVAPDLISAMTSNPGMRVFSVGGYFDLASPYFGGPYLYSQLPVGKEMRSRIEWKEYPASHSVYEVEEARRDMHDRIARMIGKQGAGPAARPSS